MQVRKKIKLFDSVVPDGISNPLYTSGDELYFACPIRDHQNDSAHGTGFSINIVKGLWHCFKCGRGGNAFELAESVMGSRPAARHLLKIETDDIDIFLDLDPLVK